MKLELNASLINRNIADDPEVMKAFVDAIHDPELREKIISILEEAELLPGSIRQPA